MVHSTSYEYKVLDYGLIVHSLVELASSSLLVQVRCTIMYYVRGTMYSYLVQVHSSATMYVCTCRSTYCAVYMCTSYYEMYMYYVLVHRTSYIAHICTGMYMYMYIYV